MGNDNALASGMMQKLIWDNSYSVGIDQFDKEHMVLFEYINDLRDVMLGKKGDDATKKLFRNIMDYTIHHFSNEEAVLFRHKYPNYLEHKDLHDHFLSEARHMYVRYLAGDTGSTMMAIEVTALLTEWLQVHIMTNDKEYALWFKVKGIVPETAK